MCPSPPKPTKNSGATWKPSPMAKTEEVAPALCQIYCSSRTTNPILPPRVGIFRRVGTRPKAGREPGAPGGESRIVRGRGPILYNNPDAQQRRHDGDGQYDPPVDWEHFVGAASSCRSS